MNPLARHTSLVIQEYDGALVIYDQDAEMAHSLNKVASLVWRHCDGSTSVPELATIVHTTLGDSRDEELVWLALEQLKTVRLLEHAAERPRPRRGVTRRQAMQRMAGTAVRATALVTMITSIVVPTPAAAQSPSPTPVPPSPPPIGGRLEMRPTAGSLGTSFHAIAYFTSDLPSGVDRVLFNWTDPTGFVVPESTSTYLKDASGFAEVGLTPGASSSASPSGTWTVVVYYQNSAGVTLASASTTFHAS